MGAMDDSVMALSPVDEAQPFEILKQKPIAQRRGPVSSVTATAAVIVARLHGFALDDAPILTALPQWPEELVVARTAVSLRREQIGATVVVAFDGGDARRPIVLGVLQDATPHVASASAGGSRVSVDADGERREIVAEREIVLRCGEASITLTRAGKVLIKGRYVLSHSTGHNRIKGAVIDIN